MKDAGPQPGTPTETPTPAPAAPATEAPLFDQSKGTTESTEHPIGQLSQEEIEWNKNHK